MESGDFDRFVERFAPDAEMSFVGVDVEPMRGRDQIRAGYEQMPPDDTMSVESVVSAGSRDAARFAWSRGGTGIMHLRWEGDLLRSLTVSFDPGPDDGDD